MGWWHRAARLWSHLEGPKALTRGLWKWIYGLMPTFSLVLLLGTSVGILMPFLTQKAANLYPDIPRGAPVWQGSNWTPQKHSPAHRASQKWDRA